MGSKVAILHTSLSRRCHREAWSIQGNREPPSHDTTVSLQSLRATSGIAYIAKAPRTHWNTSSLLVRCIDFFTALRSLARWYQLRRRPLDFWEYDCPQYNGSLVITPASAKPSVVDLPVPLSKAKTLTAKVELPQLWDATSSCAMHMPKNTTTAQRCVPLRCICTEHPLSCHNKGWFLLVDVEMSSIGLFCTGCATNTSGTKQTSSTRQYVRGRTLVLLFVDHIEALGVIFSVR